MNANEQWLVAGAPWFAAGVALLGVSLVVWALRRRKARRARRAERFRAAVRSEAKRIVRRRSPVEVDENDFTQVFRRSDPRREASGVALVQSVDDGAAVERRELEAVVATGVINRGAVLEVLGDEAG